MNNITITNYVDFFKNLDIKQKVAILKELTNELSESVNRSANQKIVKTKQDETLLINELFGVWENEPELTEETIIKRSISEKIIDFD